MGFDGQTHGGSVSECTTDRHMADSLANVRRTDTRDEATELLANVRRTDTRPNRKSVNVPYYHDRPTRDLAGELWRELNIRIFCPHHVILPTSESCDESQTNISFMSPTTTCDSSVDIIFASVSRS